MSARNGTSEAKNGQGHPPVNRSKPADDTPMAVLLQQAAELKRQTKDVLDGVAYTSDADNGYVVHSFYIKYVQNPEWSDYHYHLLSVTHHRDRSYPARVWYDASFGRNGSRAKTGLTHADASDEKRLRSRLQEIFSSPGTKKIIASLVAQNEMPVAA